MNKIKPLAFYLPQYHPIQENDEWWGKGFTEWTNVGKAKPLFKGHNQPLLPGELGYYDLRVSEVREQQAAMAKAYGVHGFVYYHYWFGNGKMLLERIAEEVLASQKPDFPFCFCWANETWSGIWHGLSNQILAEQTYPGDDDIKKHFEYLLPFFKDSRYIKVDEKPVFIVYNSNDLESRGNDYLAKMEVLAQNAGFPGLYLISSNLNKEEGVSFAGQNYDGKISFAFNKAWYKYRDATPSIWFRLVNRLSKMLLGQPYQKVRIQDGNHVFKDMEFTSTDVDTYPQILCNWDNTPRSGKRGVIIKNTTADNFKLQIDKAISFLEEQNLSEKFLIIKSWNEWAEGNILEPDRSNGFTYLETLKSVMDSYNKNKTIK